MLSQIKLHRIAKHKNICQVYNVFQDQFRIYILMQLCRNQTLFSLICKRKQITVPQAQFYLYQLVQAICYLHQHKIVHRDLKLGNILLDDNLNIKLTDFGLATKIQFLGDKKHSVCGTPNYIAPQIIKYGLKVEKSHSGHSYEVDIWSIGVILYILLIGVPPFQSDSRAKTYNKVCNADFQFPKSFKVQQAKDLIRKILVVDPSRRLSLEQILNHPFMNPVKGIPKQIPLISLKADPKLIQFQKMQENQSLKQSAKNISLSSVRSFTQSNFQKFFQQQQFVSQKTSEIQDNIKEEKMKTLKTICSFGTLPKSYQKLQILKKCMSSKAIPVLETEKKIQSDQLIGSPRDQQSKKSSQKSNCIQNQQSFNNMKNKAQQKQSSSHAHYVLSYKKDKIWSYIISNGFIGTYQTNSSYKLLYDKRLNIYIQIIDGKLKNTVLGKNVDTYEDILKRKQLMDDQVNQIKQLQKFLEDQNFQPIYIDKIYEIKNENLLLFILSSGVIQLFNYQKYITLIKYEKKYDFIEIKNQIEIKRSSLTQNQIIFSKNKDIEFLYSKMKKILNKIENKI